MAINTTDYKPTKYDGVLIHKTDSNKFLTDVTVGAKRYRRKFTIKDAHTSKDREKKAYEYVLSMTEKLSQDLGLTVDAQSTVNSYYDKLSQSKYKKLTESDVEALRDVNKKYKEFSLIEIETIVNASSSWSKERRYRNDLFYDKYIRSGLGTKAIRDVTGADLSKLNESLSLLAKRSQKVAYELLVPVFNLAIEDDLIITTPIKKSHIPKRNQQSEKKVVTDAVNKYRAIHKAILDVFKDNHHHRALFLFGFHGRRLNEVVTLQWNDIDFSNGNYVVRGENSKVDTDMQFTLPLDVSEALSHFRDIKGDVFNIKRVETLYSKIRTASGIEEFTFHWMRNLAVSALSSMGVEATHLSAMLGHTDAGTLRKYLSLQREQSTSATLEASSKLLGGSK